MPKPKTKSERSADTASMRRALKVLRPLAFMDREQRAYAAVTLSDAMTARDRPAIGALRSICAAALRRVPA